MRPLLALALLALPALAQARCPTADDLATGIVLTYDHGGSDTFRADPGLPGVVIWQGEFEGMPLGTARLGQGFILLESVGPGGSFGATTWDYGIPPADLPRPVPGTGWEGVAEVTAPDGTSTLRQIHSFGAGRAYEAGGCSYTVVPISITWPDATEELLYAVELGLSWRAGDAVVSFAPAVPPG